MDALTSAPQQIPTSRPATYRINTIDFLRGLVMIIMALDHTRDLFHSGAFTEDPLNLQTTTPLLFLTRWITHFCAPVFVFLSGVSVYLQGLRKNRKDLSAFLIKRGLWLIAVELLVISPGITFDFFYSFVLLQVIWAIGLSMVLLGLAIRLPFYAVLVLGAVIVLGHNALDFLEASPSAPTSPLYNLLHRPTLLPMGERFRLLIAYPFLPWTGIMFLGYCFGRLYERIPQQDRRRKVIATIGAAAILLFIVLRAAGVYGDLLPWSVQESGLYTVFSFINTQKYPPSLLYTCMTLGPALLLLAAMDGKSNRFTRFVTVYGRVPFLYFLLHFYLLHTVSALLYLGRGHTFSEGLTGIPDFPFKFAVPGEGYSLLIVYLVWIGVVLVLYPVCRWFSGYKERNRKWWLSYL